MCCYPQCAPQLHSEMSSEFHEGNAKKILSPALGLAQRTRPALGTGDMWVSFSRDGQGVASD